MLADTDVLCVHFHLDNILLVRDEVEDSVFQSSHRTFVLVIMLMAHGGAAIHTRTLLRSM